MKTFLIKFSQAVAVLAATSVLATAAPQHPKLHYAFLHKGVETLTVNWEGYIASDSHAQGAALWVRKDGQLYLISDKSTLAAMDKATEPLRHYPNTGDTKVDQHLRETQRTSVYAQTDKIVQEAIAKGLARPAKISQP